VQERARGPISEFGGARTSPADRTAKTLSFCLFPVCVSVTLVKDIDCAHDFAMKVSECRNDFDSPLDSGRFVVVHPCSTFSVRRQLATPQNAEVQIMAKFEFLCRRHRATE